jgi:hypothetical protein
MGKIEEAGARQRLVPDLDADEERERYLRHLTPSLPFWNSLIWNDFLSL